MVALAAVSPLSHSSKFVENCLAKCHDVLVDVVTDIGGTYDQMDIETLSNKLFERGKEITSALMQSAIEQRVADFEFTATRPCPDCSGLARCKGSKPRTIETRHGRVTFERPYYYCAGCRHGFFPTDDDLKLAADAKQYDLGRIAVDLLSSLPYEEAARLFKRTTGETFSDHCMHGLATSVGDAATVDLVLPTSEQVELLIDEYATGHRKPIVVISADGAHEPIRPDTGTRDEARGPGYWREAKGFRIYLSQDDRIEQIASWHQICDEKEFGKALKFAASLIPHDKVRIALVADGAPWIWSHLTSAFPNGRQILDYYHLSEHIHKVAGHQYAENSSKAQQWCETTLARLNFGEVDAVIWGLDRMKPANAAASDEADKLRTYLQNNQGRIDYQHNRYGGYPNGSGGIESANKYICHLRLKRPGAWWYETNANRMLRICCASYNSRLDNLIDFHKATTKRKKRGKAAPKR